MRVSDRLFLGVSWLCDGWNHNLKLLVGPRTPISSGKNFFKLLLENCLYGQMLLEILFMMTTMQCHASTILTLKMSLSSITDTSFSRSFMLSYCCFGVNGTTFVSNYVLVVVFSLFLMSFLCYPNE